MPRTQSLGASTGSGEIQGGIYIHTATAELEEASVVRGKGRPTADITSSGVNGACGAPMPIRSLPPAEQDARTDDLGSPGCGAALSA